MSINRRFLATTAAATTETEETKSVTVSGALATSVDWTDDLNDSSSALYQSTAASAKSDLETLLASSDDVQSATVTINGFEEASSSRKRRQAATSKATVNYSAECTVPESKSTDDISSSVETAVQNADPTQFDSFDSSSFASFSVTIEETTEATTQDSTTIVTNADTTAKTIVDTTIVTTAEKTTAEQSTAGQGTTGQTTIDTTVETTVKTTAGQTTTKQVDATSQSVTTTSNDATTQGDLSTTDLAPTTTASADPTTEAPTPGATTTPTTTAGVTTEDTTTADATTEAEATTQVTTVGETKSVTVSGALATNVDWNDDFNDSSSTLYQSTATSAKSDLESLLTSSDDVQSATVTINGFEEANSSRKRRQATTSKATVNYSAECTVPESKSTEDISSSVETAVQNADPAEFSSFDASSFTSFSVDVEEANEETTTATATQEPDETSVSITTPNAETTKATDAGITTAEQSTVAEITKGLGAATTTVGPTDGQTTIAETTKVTEAAPTTADQSTARPTTEEPSAQTTTVENPKTTLPDALSETTTNNQPPPTPRPTEPVTTEGNDAITTAQEVSADEAAALGELGDLSDSLGAL